MLLQIASPVCWQLGEKVLMNWFAKLKPGLLNMGRDMSIALYDYSKMISLMRKTASESHIMVFVTLAHTSLHIEITFIS